jgi:hypothetical protein
MGRRAKRGTSGGRQGLAPQDAARFHTNLGTYVRKHWGADAQGRPKRAAFAAAADLRPKTVDSWFAGRAPDLPTLVQVAQHVGWSLDGMLLDRGPLQWTKPESDPHDQLRALVVAAIQPRVPGTNAETLALGVPDGRSLVRLLADALQSTVRVRLDALRLVRTAWRHRDAPQARELVTDARRLAEQYDLPWDDRLDRVVLPRSPLKRLNPQHRRQP